MDRVAVFLRGHIRTWNFIKEENFKFFNSLSYEVDFYVSTWDTDEIRLTSLKNDFANKNLIAFLVEPREGSYDAYTGPAHMSTNLSRYRIEQELKGVNYKFIIDTRFDVILQQTSPIRIPEKLSFGSTGLTGCFDATQPNKVVAGLEDHCFLTTSAVHQIMNNRTLMSVDKLGNHIGMLRFAEIHKIECFKIDWFKGCLVRPNIINHLTKVSSFWTEHNFYESEWQRLSPHNKLKIIKDAGIDPYDYSENYHIGTIL